LATLDTPTRGDAFVDGFSVVEDPDRVRSRLGFMPDYFGTYPNVNVSEYLDFFARAYGLRGSARTRAVDHVMDFTLLSTLAQKPTDSLSKGMKQRLCLGRAMIHDPAVLVLDEPAAGLDPRARIELRDMIGRLAADGKAVLVSSHILTELSEMCHRVGIIEQGRLLAVGTVEEMRQRMEPHATVRLRVLGGAAEVGPWLEQRADVAEVRLEGEVALVSHRGDRAAEVALLRDLIQAGFPVAEFRAETKSLEDVFMHLTNGRVQ
ncbi:MAG: ATP-binding cassette domain-containing protein, partial [Planctomycetales bacterium]|nr:ATP-binding cassette domain-containing protein [Planctomycetales bacterium]